MLALGPPSLPVLNWPFLLDFLRQLNSADRDHCILESFEPEHRPDPLFHATMVLFDQVRHRPQSGWLDERQTVPLGTSLAAETEAS